MKLVKVKNSKRMMMVDDSDHPGVNMYNWFLNSNKAIIQACIDEKSTTIGKFLLNPPFGMHVDHADGNPFNNQRSNLRIVTPSQNSANSKRSKSNTTGFKGVSPYENKFRAVICKNYKQIYIGLFNSKEEAARAYNEKAIELFGEHAQLNKID